MKRRLRDFSGVALRLAAVAAALAGCAGNEAAGNLELASETEKTMSQAGGGVGGLPFANGRVFHTLDEYLGYLRERGKTDVPWYREVEPGLYELVIRGPRAPARRFTREELERRFGFRE